MSTPNFPAELLSLGTTVNGSIVTPGVQSNYNFSLSTASTLYFDFLSAPNNLKWSLSGPSGTVINNADLRYFDWDYNGNPLHLGAGAYTLTIDGVGDTTGGYEFRLLDFASATQITPGTPVSALLSPSTETDLYRFNGTAGERYFFDIESRGGSSVNASWRLLAPDGSQVFLNRGVDVDTVTLSQTGAYTLLFEGYPFDSGSGTYSFNVQPVTDPAPELLSLGTTVNGSIVTPGVQSNYNFSLSTASTLYFDFLSAPNNLKWSLSGPSGTVINNADLRYFDWDYNGNPLHLGAGAYTLTIDGVGDTTGGYEFRLLDFASATQITPGTPVSALLSPSTETDLYRFNGTAGERYFFDIESRGGSSVNASWRLLAPDGSQVFLNRGVDVDTVTLSQTGAYTLLFEGYPFDSGSGTYSFNVQPVTDPAPELLSLGTTVNGSIVTPGVQSNYNFSLSTASTLYFDFLSAPNNLKWSLSGPSGTVINNADLRYFDWDYNGNPLHLGAGAYTLTIDGVGDTTGGYEFRLLDFASATQITPGTPVSALLSPSTETAFQ